MTVRRRARIGQLGLWLAVLSVRRGLLLGLDILGPPGNGAGSDYCHACQDPDCRAEWFTNDSSESRLCGVGRHYTVAAALVNGTIPRPTRSTALFIYVCLENCGVPPVRLPEDMSPRCRNHRPEKAMTLLAKP